MSYVVSALTAGEQIRDTGRFHWFQKLSVLVLCSAAFWLSKLWANPDSATLASSAGYLLTAIGIYQAIMMWSTEVVITDRRLIYKKGWIARSADEISLRKVEEVNLRQSILGRLLGYGRIYIQGTGGAKIALPTLAQPMQLRQKLQQAQELYERT